MKSNHTKKHTEDMRKHEAPIDCERHCPEALLGRRSTSSRRRGARRKDVSSIISIFSIVSTGFTTDNHAKQNNAY